MSGAGPRGALNVNDAARYLGVSRATVYRLSKECSPDLPVVHIGGRRVFRIVDLDRYLERNVVRPRGAA